MFVSILLGFMLVTVVLWTISSNSIINTVMLNKTHKAIDNITKEVSKDVSDDDIGNLYPVEDELGKPIDYKTGQEGNGVNLLLINNIKTEGYVKELLQLYADSEAGKITKFPHHFPIYALLGLQKNETGTYGVGVVKSYLPFDSKARTIVWGKEYKGIPAAAMKLRQLNRNVINTAPPGSGVTPTNQSNKLPYNINGLNPLDGGRVYNSGSSRDINAFQVNRTLFHNTSYNGSVVPATISGWGDNPNRSQSDAYYLPDNLSYLDQQFSSMIKSYGLESLGIDIQTASYSMYHNAGLASWSQGAGYGVNHNTKGKLATMPSTTDTSAEAKARREDYAKNVTTIPSDIVYAIKNSGANIRDQHGRAIGTFLLLKHQYYLTPEALETLTSGSYVNKNSGYALKAWEAINGEKVTASQLKDKLRPYVKSVLEVYPGYTDAATFKKVYGYSSSIAEKSNGGVWKLSDYTSDVYRNKINGKSPRVLHVTNLITIGHVVDTTSMGKYAYADMLKYAGVDVDVTKPDTYYNKVKDEFKPPVSDFAGIMKDIGADTSNSLVFNMLKFGYDRSGFWYYLGGQALPVSQANYNRHYAYATGKYAGSFTAGKYATKMEYFKAIYATKDGSVPSANQPDNNLVNFGKFLYDCSSFTAHAYNSVVKKAVGGESLPAQASSQLNSGLLKTVSEDSPRTGDIYVNSTHVCFYLATHKGESMTTDTANTKIEKEQAVNAGYLWVLEAPTSNKKVGIRVRSKSYMKIFTLRRFKALE
jgi:hypothetical protein